MDILEEADMSDPEYSVLLAKHNIRKAQWAAFYREERTSAWRGYASVAFVIFIGLAVAFFHCSPLNRNRH